MLRHRLHFQHKETFFFSRSLVSQLRCCNSCPKHVTKAAGLRLLLMLKLSDLAKLADFALFKVLHPKFVVLLVAGTFIFEQQ